MSGNPQYHMEVEASTADSTVWIVLARHITEKVDFAHNKHFITLLIYSGGEKVYYPSEKKLQDGIRINSPFYLTKLKVPKSSSSRKYTLVVSEFEKRGDMHFTMTVYANLAFKLNPIDDDAPFSYKRIEGEWRKETAGGCPNYPDSYHTNPVHTISVECPTTIVAEIRGPKKYSVNLCIETFDKKKVSNSGSYRPGYAMAKMFLAPGKYIIRCSTFYPGEVGPYYLDIKSDNKQIKF